MSYQGYSATPPPPGTITPTTTPYGYGAYPSPYASIPATGYSYPPGAYQAGVTGYGWSYPYSYVPQAHHPGMTAAAAAAAVAHIQRPATTTTAAVPPPVVPHTPVAPAAPAPPQRAATFTAYTPSYARESVPAHSTGRRGGRSSNLKGLFAKELKNLMYGFGDDRNPANDTVNVMEEMLIEYITDICQTATGPTKKSRLSIDDLRRALSRPADAKKLARMEELLFMQEDIKRARAQFEESDTLNPKGI